MPGVWYIDRAADTEIGTRLPMSKPTLVTDSTFSGIHCGEASKKRKLDHGDLDLFRPQKRISSNLPYSPPLRSTLERLPLELLEQILVESRNVSLMHSSGYLYRTLSSDRCKKELVLRCLHNYDVGLAGEVAFTEFQPFSQRSSDRPMEDTNSLVLSADASRRDLHRLLEQSWVTMALVKSVIKEWSWDLATAELQRFIKSSDLPASSYPAALPELRAKLDKCTSNMPPSDWQYFRTAADLARLAHTANDDDVDKDCPFAFRWPPVSEPVGPCGRLLIYFLENAYLNVTPLGHIMSQVLCRSDDNSTCHAIRTFERRFIPWRLSQRDLIPARLLCGPWTQDRGDLLKFLLDACDNQAPGLSNGFSLDSAEPDISPHQETAAQLGVLAALRENCELAIHTLVPQNLSYNGLCSRADWPLAFCSADAEVRARGQSTCAPPDPWLRLSWNQEGAPSLGVRLTTEILQECVAPGRFEMHPDLSIMVLQRLLDKGTRMPKLPAGFMDRVLAIARDRSVGWEKRLWAGSIEDVDVLAKKSDQLYRLYVELGLKSKQCKLDSGSPRPASRTDLGVRLQDAGLARISGADVSLYISQTKASGSENGFRRSETPEIATSWLYGL